MGRDSDTRLDTPAHRASACQRDHQRATRENGSIPRHRSGDLKPASGYHIGSGPPGLSTPGITTDRDHCMPEPGSPRTMIALAVLSIDFIGDGLRDALDPHLIQ